MPDEDDFCTCLEAGHECNHVDCECVEKYTVRSGLDRIEANLSNLLERMDLLMSDQSRLDADVASLNTGLDAVEAEIKNLKNTNPTLDLSALESSVARVKADATTPTPNNPNPNPNPPTGPIDNPRPTV